MLQLVRKQHEDAKGELSHFFVERYRDLYRWALQITDADRSAAEDLVQEAYVTLAEQTGDFGPHENVDGYLYCVLRNLHRSRLRRNAKRGYHDHLSVTDFDSLYLRLHGQGASIAVELHDELRKLCTYLCLRKERSSAASTFLLRFFRGYLPEEIMSIACISRASVDTNMRLARVSAKKYLQQSARSSQEGIQGEPHKQQLRYAVNTDALLISIRSILSEACAGTCLTHEEIVKFYGSSRRSKPGTDRLSHIVSCELCLERISRGLDIPPPSDRSPLDEPQLGQKDAERKLRHAQQLLREILAHKPSALTLAVNGDVILRFDVTSNTLRQVVSLPALTKIDFVEVFGDAGVRLLMIHVENEPPHGSPEILRTIRLSCDRVLTVSIAWFGLEPKVHVSYELFAAEFTGQEIATTQRTLDSNEEKAVSGSPFLHGSYPHESSWWRRVLNWQRSNRILLSVIAMASVTFLCLMLLQYRITHPKAQDAQAIIARSIQADAALISSGDLLHQVVTFEEIAPSGELVRTQHVEVWKQGQQLAKRLYDSNGHLLAGEWQDANDHRSTVHEGDLNHGGPDASAPCGIDHAAWTCDLSIAALKQLAPETANWHVRQTASDYVVEIPASPSRPSLVRANLIIDRKSMRGREQDLWFSDGGRVRHYRYAEISYERRAAIDTDAPVFRPGAPVSSRRLRRAPSGILSTGNGNSAILHLHLQVLQQLHLIGADVGEPIDILATSAGKLKVKGILSSDARARSIRSSLAVLSHNPLLQIEIRSASEVARNRAERTSKPISIDSIEIDATHPPSADILVDHFKTLGYTGAQLDEKVYAYTQSVSSESARALQQAWALHQLAQLTRQKGAHALSPDDQEIFFGLVQAYTTRLAADLGALEDSIVWLPDFSSGESSADAMSEETMTLDAAADAVLANVTALNKSLHVRLQASASASTSDSPDPPNAPLHLKRSLLMARNATFRIEHATQQYLAHAVRP